MQKRSILFGSYNTAAHGFWTLTALEFPTPDPVTHLVQVPGRLTGPLDLSTALTSGEPRYGSRNLRAVFESSEGDRAARQARIEEMINTLHGQRVNIVLPDTPDYYAVGRLTVRQLYNDLAHASVEVTGVCEPWIMKQNPTRVLVSFCGKNLLDTTEDNQLAQVYGSVEYIPDGFRKKGRYFVGFPVLVNPNTTYFLSVNIKKITGASTPASGGRIAIYDKRVQVSVAQFPSAEGDAVFTFNSGVHTEVNVLFYSDSDAELGVYEFTRAQVEPLRATAYEPYTPEPEKEVVLLNERRPVVPTIICSKETTITMNGGRYVLTAGTHEVLDFMLGAGETRVALSGSGAAHIFYQEGSL